MKLQFSARQLLLSIIPIAIGVALVVSVLHDCGNFVDVLGQWLLSGALIGGAIGSLCNRPLAGLFAGMGFQLLTFFFVAGKVVNFC